MEILLNRDMLLSIAMGVPLISYIVYITWDLFDSSAKPGTERILHRFIYGSKTIKGKTKSWCRAKWRQKSFWLDTPTTGDQWPEYVDMEWIE